MSNVDWSGYDRIQSELREVDAAIRAGKEPGQMHGQLLGMQDWAQARELFLRQRGLDGGVYLRETFKPNDRIAVVLIKGNHVIQRIDDAGRFSKDFYQQWLHDANDRGYGVYVSQNSLKPEATGRKREDLAHVRHVWLDLDKGGLPALDKVLNHPDIPKPHYVLNTSPEKYQVIWRAEKFAGKQLDPLLKNLAKETGADPAATDASRVLRMPGFRNQKYPEIDHWVTVERLGPVGDRVRPEQFPERLYAREKERVRIAEPAREIGQRVSPDLLVDRALREVPQQGRNKAGFALATQLRDNGFSSAEAERVMRGYRSQVPDVNMQGRREPYTEREMKATLWSAYRSPAREPWTTKKEPERNHVR